MLIRCRHHFVCMKAIIVAAGPGKRLLPYTEDKPKCMLEVGGKTILQTTLTALRENGITDIVIVKGHKKDVINYPDIKYYYNPNYLENNILTSLFCAEEEMKEIEKISKFMNPDIAHGEFIGLSKFTRKGAETLIRNYKRIRTSQWCGFKAHHRFQDAISIDKAYLTDVIQELIDRGYPIYSVDVNGGWLEIDTQQDLQIARARIEDVIERYESEKAK